MKILISSNFVAFVGMVTVLVEFNPIQTRGLLRPALTLKMYNFNTIKAITTKLGDFIIGSKHREKIVSRCFELMMKDEARVFDMASQRKQ